MKNNLGITMVELVIVVVIILIIASFAVASGRDTLDQADITAVYVEMDAMKEAVNGVIAKQNFDETFIIEKGKQYDLEFTPAAGVTYPEDILTNQNEWYIIFGQDNEAAYESSEVKDNLGLDAISNSYIVNYTNADVLLYKPVTVANNSVMTYEQIRSLVEE